MVECNETKTQLKLDFKIIKVLFYFIYIVLLYV